MEAIEPESPVVDSSSISVLHQALVDQLVQTGTIRTARVEAAFRAVPRHLFLPETPMEQVYQDQPIGTKRTDQGYVSSSSQPSAMANMLEQLGLEPGQRVLEIGAGTGYNAAIMAHIVGETGGVTTVDIDEDIVAQAGERLGRAGVGHVQVVCGDGGYGYAGAAPYDRIILTAGTDDIPPAWWEQLKPTGRLLLPLILHYPYHAPVPFQDLYQVSVAFQQRGDCLVSVSTGDNWFMPLRGAFAVPTAHIQRVQLGPDVSLELQMEEDVTVDTEMIYRLLSGPGQDLPVQVNTVLFEFLSRWQFWHWCHPSHMSCALSAVGVQADQGVVPYLMGVAGQYCFTVGLVGKEGIAVCMRPPGQALPRGSPWDAQPFELYVRSFGPNDELARRLIDSIVAWDAAGRPPDPLQLRVRAYPKGANCTLSVGEHLIDRPHAQLVVGW